MNGHYEDCIKLLSDEELIKALRDSLPEKVPYGHVVGAEEIYPTGPMVWHDPECYFMSEAADRLEKYSREYETVRHGRWVMKETMVRSPLAKNAYCSECLEETSRCRNYCSNCGAKMDKED